MGRGSDCVDGHIDLLSTMASALGRRSPSLFPGVMFCWLARNVMDRPGNPIIRTHVQLRASHTHRTEVTHSEYAALDALPFEEARA
jgi:hypothetical protein